jgi:hypothetical protein
MGLAKYQNITQSYRNENNVVCKTVSQLMVG